MKVTKVVKYNNNFRVWEDGTIEQVQEKTAENEILDNVPESDFSQEELTKFKKGNYLI